MMLLNFFTNNVKETVNTLQNDLQEFKCQGESIDAQCQQFDFGPSMLETGRVKLPEPRPICGGQSRCQRGR